ncbi:TetR/AcrR family transcriptional regulator [uncultured Anaeromusa sp.]|uniref:TetR/AcrR family transcriptional regulator n=1 Tax=uncultured Anaeromusa sp. TaxID=673273 RepID=UPI0029C7705C|nr:TetR/AcrR family transcriptional regulator [uncultured Anaeromusa sp.]
MRVRDENKSEAIFQATIQLLNESGFSNISMSKIAKLANVSPATIYVYFDNKEDMLSKLYLHVKQKMSLKMFTGLDPAMPIKDSFELIQRNYIVFILENKDEFLFLEQFSNTPLVKNLNLTDLMELFQPFFDLVARGQEEKALKNCDVMLLATYLHTPLSELAKRYFKGEFEFTEQNKQDILQICWDAIKA